MGIFITAIFTNDSDVGSMEELPYGFESTPQGAVEKYLADNPRNAAVVLTSKDGAWAVARCADETTYWVQKLPLEEPDGEIGFKTPAEALEFVFEETGEPCPKLS